MTMTMTMRQPNAGRRSEGFIVVAVLWIMSALATLALIYSTYLANAAITLSLTSEKIEAEALTTAALELTAYRLAVPAAQPTVPAAVPAAQPTVPAADQKPTRGFFTFRLGRGNVSVNFISETARIDLNAAPKELLSGLFTVLGAQRQNADQYADRIIAWRTPLDAQSEDGEDALYRAAGLLYSPRRAPFAHTSELSLVVGLPPALVERATSFLTVFSGRPEVNIRDAAPEVIAALATVHPDVLNNSLGGSGATAGQAVPGVTTDGSDAVRLQVRVALDNGRQTASEAVILVRGDDEPYRILSWRDDAESPGTASRALTDFR
jgi:general secretion pathway protein K